MSIDRHMSAELAAELAAHNVRKLVDPRGIPVRFSRLRHLSKSPLHYLAACQDDDTDTLARKLGRGAHALVLKQPVAVWDEKTDSGRARPRSGKDWELFKDAHAGVEILNAKEYAHSKAIAEAIQRHPRASELLYGVGTLHEHKVEWEFCGRRCLSHIDAYRRGAFVIDLKCARDGSLDRFGKTAIWSHYHSQLAFYAEAVESLGHPTPDAYIIAVESESPHAVTVRPLTARAIEAGRRQCRLWMEQLLACEAANEWPGYSAVDVEIDLNDGMDAFLFPAEEAEQ